MKPIEKRMSEELSDDLFEVVGREGQASEQIDRPQLSSFKDSWMRLSKNKGALISLVVLAVVFLLAIFGPYMNEYKYYETDYAAAYQPPGEEHWLGTDKFGRDQWTRIWEGTRISLFIAILAALLDLFIGVTYGAVSALIGGKTDNMMQRVIEILVGIPNLIIIILLIMLMKPGILTITIAMVITGWVNMARLMRAQIFKLKEQEFVLAARSLGAGNKRLIVHHLIPNTIGIIVINMMFTIPSAIFTEAFLSFIGLGLQEPTASLGVLINDGFQGMRNHFYLLLYPAIVIVAIMVSFNILADGMRDALDPRMRK
ncbi:ABC transporter permease [Cytobacillus purgationiresistens]|uniref:Oligopeptide transport system permease protein n=1 Tax=Cytobacillus purgationiresistens TaxID=863449 RepID=A0ABU0AH51_9BACI|nr:ABC transporter permease [Cytobacillus purgationiresistens]MDQ0270582.1 oligopeptide transport system permease protein [Cytobacillus purgationiresistens]